MLSRLRMAVSAFTKLTGWDQEDMLRHWPAGTGDHTHRPAALSRAAGVDGSGEQSVTPYTAVEQYASTRQKCRDMAMGKVKSLRAPWRSIWKDGCLYEVNITMFVAEAHSVEEEGRTFDKPTRVTVGFDDDQFCIISPM